MIVVMTLKNDSGNDIKNDSGNDIKKMIVVMT